MQSCPGWWVVVVVEEDACSGWVSVDDLEEEVGGGRCEWDVADLSVKCDLSAPVGQVLRPYSISFLMNKYNSSSHAQSEEKVAQRLQHLLMRAGTIIEEADTRYITNSGMMMQLKILSEAMYRGYSELDNLRYRALQDGAGCFDKVSINDSSSSSLHLSLPFKRSRITTEKDDKVKRLGSHGALESLEVAIANMAEFIILLGGCKRMFRRPYDIYLYTENFMFGRHTEKQKLLSFLLEHNNPPTDHAPAVLPIIGGASIGKKTLVAHVCGDERVRIQRLARFGSVKPILLSDLSYDELRYLFKTLAFGSVDSTESPQLVEIADKFVKQLHSTHGALVAASTFADVLRMNLSVQFWRCILDKRIRYAKRNLSTYGVQAGMLLEEGHPVDITDLALHPLSMTRCTIDVSIKEESPKVTMKELLADPSVRPQRDFILIAWESRIPPHKTFPHFVTSRAQDIPEEPNSDELPLRKPSQTPPPYKALVPEQKWEHAKHASLLAARASTPPLPLLFLHLVAVAVATQSTTAGVKQPPRSPREVVTTLTVPVSSSTTYVSFMRELELRLNQTRADVVAEHSVLGPQHVTCHNMHAL
ncbi:hypothetical protein D1007_33059 [Hordeum vulgare]|nr:hypothetical protein D1007_33059 [Hordeum vulgare]